MIALFLLTCSTISFFDIQIFFLSSPPLLTNGIINNFERRNKFRFYMQAFNPNNVLGSLSLIFFQLHDIYFEWKGEFLFVHS